MQRKKIIAIDIGASKIRTQIVGEDGSLGVENSLRIVGLNPDNHQLTQILIHGIEPITKDEEVTAISIGAPGSIDSSRGIIKFMPNIKGVKNLNITDELKKIFDLPVFLLNDADAAALGEIWLGAGIGYKNLVYLNLGSGVGSGIIAENKLEAGSELGHTQLKINEEERLCNCGRKNCVESFLGTRGLAHIYLKTFNITDSKLDNSEIYSLSPKMKEGILVGDKNWSTVMNKYVEYLAIFLKDVIGFRQPEIIIIGGGIAHENQILLKDVKQRIPMYSNIVLAKLENPGIIGLAKYAFDNLKGGE